MDVAITDFDAGLRKAAILAASLDEAAADALFDVLGPEQAEAVRHAVAALDEIDVDERARVVEEFHRIGPMIPKGSPAGIELTELSAGQVSRRGDRAGAETCLRSLSPFGFLRGIEDASVARLLSDERPATIALVLSHLPPEQGGEVLARLDAGLQMEVIRRLANLDETDPETLEKVENAIESRLLQQSEDERRCPAGPDSAARILAACDGQVRGQILDNLAAQDQSLAERLGHRTFDFDDLVRLDDRTLRSLVAAAGPELMQAALLGASPEVSGRLLSCLPRKEAKLLRRKLAHPDPIRLSEVEEARRRVASLASETQPDRVPIDRIAA